MSEESDDAGGEHIVFGMLVGAVFGAALGAIVLQNITQGVVAGVVVGILVAMVFPAWTSRLFEGVTDTLEE